MGQTVVAQTYTVSSPEGNIVLTIDNGSKLTYSVSLEGDVMIAPSPMGFEFKGEAPMTGGFKVLGEPKQQGKVEEWTPVVANKHSFISVPYSELVLNLQEKDTPYRKMDVTFRVMNDGVAFRYTL
jgi:alpha-glucosidase